MNSRIITLGIIFGAAILLGNEVAMAKAELPHGYLLAQIVSTHSRNVKGAISSPVEAEALFTQIQGRVDGVEYQTLSYSSKDVAAHKAIAEIARRKNIDLWMTSWRMTRRLASFVKIKPEHRAYVMDADGTIRPAVKDGAPVVDLLNPDAVKWLLSVYRRSYLEPMRGLTQGYFINEDAVPYMAGWRNNVRIDYWNSASYSPASLRAWQKYCARQEVTSEGALVNKFPVHRRDMVLRGSGMTAYYPGYDVPEKIYAGQKFVELPRAKGVWEHWYEYLSEQFANNWISRLSATVNDVNKDNQEWYGVLYFGLHQWLIAYERIEAQEFKVPEKHRFGAWALQRGVDLHKLVKIQSLDMIVCETYPPLAGTNIEYFIREFIRITRGSGKKIGVMLHRDDRWKLTVDEERRRWDMINKYNPDIIARFPLKHMVSGGKYYDAEMERYFYGQLERYRKK